MRSRLKKKPIEQTEVLFSEEYYRYQEEDDYQTFVAKEEQNSALIHVGIPLAAASVGAAMGAMIGWYVGLALAVFTFGISIIASPVIGGLIGAMVGLWAGSKATEPKPEPPRIERYSEKKSSQSVQQSVSATKNFGSKVGLALENKSESLEVKSDLKKAIDKPLIRVDIYKEQPAYSEFLPWSHYDSHAAAIVTRLQPEGQVAVHNEYRNKFIVSYGYRNANYYDSKEKFEKGIKAGKYSVVSLYAYEDAGKGTFEDYTRESRTKFPPENVDKYNSATRNCAHAAEHPIFYFGIAQHETGWQKAARIAAEILCGCCGTVCGIGACPAFPGVETPTSLYRYAKVLRDSPLQIRLQEEARKYEGTDDDEESDYTPSRLQ